jgi:hypothetical protein
MEEKRKKTVNFVVLPLVRCRPQYYSAMANCIKTLSAYYGRPTLFEKVFPSSRPWSVRTVAPPKLTLGTDLKTKFITMTVLTVAAFVYIIFTLIYVKIVRLL